MDELYKKASKQKLRFRSEKGLVSVEDLWDIPLLSKRSTSVDNIAKLLNAELKTDMEESFVIPVTKQKTITELKFEIVKDVIKTRQEDAKLRENKSLKKANKERIMALIADKENDELKGKTKAELEKMIFDL